MEKERKKEKEKERERERESVHILTHTITCLDLEGGRGSVPPAGRDGPSIIEF